MGAASIARSRGESSVSTEHLLLSLFDDAACAGCRVLLKLGVDIRALEGSVANQPVRGADIQNRARLSPRGKRVIDLAYDEARRLHDHYIGTEHLLLGLVREEEGVAGQALLGQGVMLGRARAAVAEIQGKDLSALTRRQSVIERLRALFGPRGEE